MADTERSTVTIDDVQYDIDNLNDKAKAALTNLRATDAELQRLRAQTAIAQTARNTFGEQLRANLPEGGDEKGGKKK